MSLQVSLDLGERRTLVGVVVPAVLHQRVPANQHHGHGHIQTELGLMLQPWRRAD